MKKIFVSILTLLFVFSCSEKKEVFDIGSKNDVAKLGLFGKVREVLEVSYRAKDSLGTVLKKNRWWSLRWKYDELKKFDLDQKLTELIKFNEDSTINEIVQFVYNQVDSLIEKRTFQELERRYPLDIEISKYDIQNFKLEKYKLINRRKDTILRSVYLTDSIGRYIQIDKYRNGKFSSKVKQKFDKNSNIINQLISDSERIIKTNYDYNTKGLLVRSESFLNDSIWSWNDFAYNSNDKLIAKSGELIGINSSQFYEYDDFGNKTRFIQFGFSDIHYIYEYEYDKYNNWVRCVRYEILNEEYKRAEQIIERHIKYY